MELILCLTHANMKTPIYIARPLIFSVYYSEAQKATYVVAAGGAIIPVQESVDKVVEMWKTNSNSTIQGETNE